MEKVTIELFSDILCIWAYGAQPRIDQLKSDYGSQIELRYRFIPVFAAAHRRIEDQWQEKGGYAGFNSYLHELVASWDDITLHPDVWQKDPPHSSTPSHLYVKGMQLLEQQGTLAADDMSGFNGRTVVEEFLWRVRCAFFRNAHDISSIEILDNIAQEMGIACAAVHRMIDSGAAHAALHLDSEVRDRYLVPGSPTLVFNEGRQRLYGNVGYRIIDVNIRELLRDNQTGEASWC
ncbi:MAG TPA: disulfide bond formation protein DsbA [Gammaproteobacteria bacterium]|nr:disulfide bond formation protein DsbA [Gammaproteobacteria bacterium]